MRVGIITLDGHYNYGNRLQNYALGETLNRLSGTSKTIWHEEWKYLEDIYLKFDFKSIIRYILNYRKFRSLSAVHYNERANEIIRQYRIAKFSNLNIDIQYKLTINENLNNSFDYFVVGSDQVWNPYFIANIETFKKTYFLRFAEEQKRMAYAASFGISELPAKYYKLFKEGLEGIPYISVREQAGAEIVKQLTGRDVPVLVDPTLLIEAEHWCTLEMQPKWYHGEKFILTYFLGDVPPMLDKLARKYNYKIFNLMDKNNFELYVSRVEEFLYLIDHAELVCTDSFHACVFSILFNTPFLVVNRQQQGVADMTSRLDTLLGLFNMKDRYINFNTDALDKDRIFTVDYIHVKDIQQREQKRSYEFLKQAMNIK